MIHPDLDCVAARTALSARLDGELDAALTDERVLRAHLAACGACRTHERELRALATAFAELRDEPALSDLWPSIERRARRAQRAPPLLLRVAAGLLGFLGLGGAVWFAQRGLAPRASERHLFERVSAPAPALETLFASLPEYRLLHLSTREDQR